MSLDRDNKNLTGAVLRGGREERMKLKSKKQVEAYVRGINHGGTLLYDVFAAVVSLSTLLLEVGKEKEALNAVPKNIRSIFYEE